MAFDEKLADRIRRKLVGKKGVVEQKMFGGVGFLIHGNMACGIHGTELILRCAPEETDKVLAMPNARPFDLMKRPMKKPMRGWVLVGAKGFATAAALAKWLKIGADYAAALPPK